MWFNFLNPNIAYIFIWAFTAFLINLQLTTNLKELNGPPSYIILSTCLIALVFFFVFKIENKIKKRKLHQLILNSNKNSIVISKWSSVTFRIWFFLVILDLVYTGSFPLINVIRGDPSGYSDLGIPSIKGLTHTLYYLNSTLYFCEIFFNSKEIKKSKIRLSLIIIYPLLMLSRALIVGVILQVMFCYLYRLKFKISLIIKIFINTCFFVFVFGVVGDYRGEYQNPFSFLIDPRYDVLNQLPSGITWVYIYITANFNNILISHGTFEPNGSVQEIFYNLIPGALKSLIFSGKNTEFSPVLLDENLNVASMYVGYVSGFGIAGAIVGGIVFIFIGNILFFYLFKRPNIGMLMANSVFFSCIVMSIFYDAFLTVSTFSQIIVCLLMASRLYKRS